MSQEVETPRLLLKPVIPADRDDLFALEQDPDVMRFLNGGGPTPPDGIDPSVDFLMPRGIELGVWSAREKVSGAFVGWFSLYDRGDGSAELKRVAIFQIRSLRFRLLILRMSLPRNRFPLSGDML
ncbi:GNAT family N-acetyltransferase [Mesorhizobium sp. B2-7-1]|uniref:GNAT family N-acetyltransferase n=1 Tax=Mesorhizobium sp. B2-7-1 TaxID=2589909 RepID=UPI0015E3D46B|nr:GNAT family N-acetyltransferase [Mesorhizobium sp. B2-7-1]